MDRYENPSQLDHSSTHRQVALYEDTNSIRFDKDSSKLVVLSIQYCDYTNPRQTQQTQDYANQRPGLCLAQQPPQGGGGHIHSSSMENHANYKHTIMLAQNKNTEDTRQGHSHDDHHRASLYGYINHSWYLSSHHSTKPDKYDGSARISLQEGVSLATHDSTDQIELFASSAKLYEEHIPLATTPPPRETSPQDMSITMANHSFSPTVTTATLKRHEPIKMDKHRELLTKVYMKTNGDSHRLSTSKHSSLKRKPA